MTYALSSQQVSWSEVRAFVEPLLAAVGEWPMPGSPAWCALDEHDPVKWASLLDAAQHWALRLEHFQQAECEASQDVSAACSWAAIARRVRDRREFEREHPWARRSAS